MLPQEIQLTDELWFPKAVPGKQHLIDTLLLLCSESCLLTGSRWRENKRIKQDVFISEDMTKWVRAAVTSEVYSITSALTAGGRRWRKVGLGNSSWFFSFNAAACSSCCRLHVVIKLQCGLHLLLVCGLNRDTSAQVANAGWPPPL